MMKRLVLVALLSGFLFGCDYFKADTRSPEKLLELKEKCSKTGKAYFDSYLGRSLPQGFLWDEPEYHYSGRLNTCLVHIRIVSTTPGVPSIHQNQVIDVFANKAILNGYFERDTKRNLETLSATMNGDVPNFTSTEYFRQKDKLFSE